MEKEAKKLYNSLNNRPSHLSIQYWKSKKSKYNEIHKNFFLKKSTFQKRDPELQEKDEKGSYRYIDG